MKTAKRLASALLCAMLLLPMCTSAEGSKGVLYHVTGGKNDLYLLGSIHIGNESMYPVSDAISDALDAADTLVLECDSESTASQLKIMGMMSYPIGETLKAHISEQTWELLEAACKKNGYNLASFNALHPWAVTSTLSVDSTAAEMGVDNVTDSIALGVERQIGKLAEGKSRAYLETAEEQLLVMDSFSPELQEYMLYAALMSIVSCGEIAQAGEEDLKSWPDWWRDGEADKFADSYLYGMANDPKPELMEEYHQGLVVNRNRNMADRLKALIESDEPHSYFAVIGLLHLVLPDDSVAALLTDMGYTVERIS